MALRQRRNQTADVAIVVEGYMDVIAMHQHGFENVVAVMGTALTEQHAQELSKYSKNVILMLILIKQA